MSRYPFINDNGQTVWACCESSIGPTCEHLNDDPTAGFLFECGWDHSSYGKGNDND